LFEDKTGFLLSLPLATTSYMLKFWGSKEQWQLITEQHTRLKLTELIGKSASLCFLYISLEIHHTNTKRTFNF